MPQTIKKAKSIQFLSLEFASALLVLFVQIPCWASTQIDELPLVRGPGISQEAAEAYAEAQGRMTLSEQLDTLRPGSDNSAHLNQLVERAQTAWLSGSVESARSIFREIGHRALDADWREPQREAIFYSMVRLAQSAPTPTEGAEWLEKAVSTFSDLQPDGDVFPPPLMEAFRTTRKRVLALAVSYEPATHFPDHRYLLINGKRYVLTPDLKIRLPKTIFRVTALSDAFPPMTEKLSLSQMEAFRLSLPPLAEGTCATPNSSASLNGIKDIAVMYSVDCIRMRVGNSWLPKNVDIADPGHATPPALSHPEENQFDRELASGSQVLTAEKPAVSSKKTWLYIGLGLLAAGAAYALVESLNKPTTSAAPAQVTVVPTHTVGF